MDHSDWIQIKSRDYWKFSKIRVWTKIRIRLILQSDREENRPKMKQLQWLLCLQPPSPTSVNVIDIARHNISLFIYWLHNLSSFECELLLRWNYFSQTVFESGVSSSVSKPSSNVDIQVWSSILKSVKRKYSCSIFHHFSMTKCKLMNTAQSIWADRIYSSE